jgi:ankyrin repeat protein
VYLVVTFAVCNTNYFNDEFSAKLFDAIYENNFELAKTLIDGGKVDVNTKNDYGDTPLIVTCQQTTLETEEEAVLH